MRLPLTLSTRSTLRFAFTLALALLLLILTTAPNSARAQDWPQWRGPNRDGHAAPSTKLPNPLPAELKLLWKTEVGEGYSSPIIVGGRVYLMARQAEQEVFYALDAATGKVAWRTPYDAPVKVHSAAVGAGPGPKATVAVADGRVFGLGLWEILTGLDAASGKILWQHRFDQEFKPIWPETGASSSPLVLGSLCITQVGTENKGGLTAFDAATGKQQWQTPGDGPSYTAATLHKLAGRDQIVTFTQEHLIGADPKNGSQLWSVPFKTGYNQNIVDPIVYNDLVIYTGVDEPIRAVKITASPDGKFEANEVWRNKGENSYMNAPVIVGDYIYMLSGKRSGSIVCLSAADGHTLWQGPGRVGDYATITVVGDKLLVLPDGGEVHVLAADPAAYKALAKWRVAETPTWSHPSVVGNQLFIKDQQHLMSYSLSN